MNIVAELVKISLNDKKFSVSADDISRDCGSYFWVDIRNSESKETTSLCFPSNISLKDFMYEVERIKYNGVL